METADLAADGPKGARSVKDCSDLVVPRHVFGFYRDMYFAKFAKYLKLQRQDFENGHILGE